MLGWSKGPFSIFCKIKDTFFIFTNNFIGLDTLSVCVGYLSRSLTLIVLH